MSVYWWWEPVTTIAAAGAGGGITEAIGFGTETDEGQPLARRKTKTLGFGEDTETGQPLNRVKRKTLGFASETDAAQPIVYLPPVEFDNSTIASRGDSADPFIFTHDGRSDFGTDFSRGGVQGVLVFVHNIQSSGAITDTVKYNGLDLNRLGDVGQGGSEPSNIDTWFNGVVGYGNGGTVNVEVDTNAGDNIFVTVVTLYGQGNLGVVRYFADADPATDSFSFNLDPVGRHVLGFTSIISGIDAEGDLDEQSSPAMTTLELEATDPVSGDMTVRTDRTSARQSAPFDLGWNTFLSGNETISFSTVAIGKPVIIGALGLAEETDTAIAIAVGGGEIVVALGRADETDEAQPLGRRKSRTLGLATESDAGVSVASRKTKTVGFATETDTAIALGRRKTKTLGFASETDTGQPLGKRKTKTLGFASETDTAIAVVRTVTIVLGFATETDTAVALARRKSRTVGFSSETDIGLPLARRKSRTLGTVDETDTAFGVGRRKTKTIGRADETDTGQGIAYKKSKALGFASETDTGQPVGRRKVKALSFAAEVDQALPVHEREVLGTSLESDIAVGVGKRKTLALGVAEELDEVAYRKLNSGNRIPDYRHWTLTGSAFINADGELEMTGAGTATSPQIILSSVLNPSWSFTAEYWSDAAAPTRTLDSAYFQADHVNVATNRLGATTNNDVQAFPPGAWTNRADHYWFLVNGIGAGTAYLTMTITWNQASTFKSRLPAFAQHGGGVPSTIYTEHIRTPTTEDFTVEPAFRRVSRKALGFATETDAAVRLLIDLVGVLGVATETDTAFAALVAHPQFTFMPPDSGTENRYPKSRTPAGRLFPRLSGSPIHYAVLVFPDGSIIKTRRPNTTQTNAALYYYLGPREYLLSHDEWLILRDSEFADDLVPTGGYG